MFLITRDSADEQRPFFFCSFSVKYLLKITLHRNLNRLAPIEIYLQYAFLPCPRFIEWAMSIRNLFRFLLLFLLFLYQAVTQGKNKPPHGQCTSDPRYFYKFWNPYTITSSGPIRSAPTPSTPPPL